MTVMNMHAVGPSPTTEQLSQAGHEMMYVPQLCGLVQGGPYENSNPDFTAGDAGGIEEASATWWSECIAGLSAASSLGYQTEPRN